MDVLKLDLQLQYHKFNIIIAFKLTFVLIALVFLFSGCTVNQEEDEIETIPIPSLPLAAFEGEFLYGNIPKPTEADVYVFMNSEDEKYYHYSFQFDNFTIEEAKDYVELLEETVIQKRLAYDIYKEDSEFPTLNYFGWVDAKTSISFAQGNKRGGMSINVEKSTY